MIRSPATLTIANFNRQTLADLLRPVLDRAMKQGMVGTNVVLEIVAEALSKIGDTDQMKEPSGCISGACLRRNFMPGKSIRM